MALYKGTRKKASARAPSWVSGSTIRLPRSVSSTRCRRTLTPWTATATYPEAGTALRDRLDVLYGTTRPTPEGTVVRLRGQAGRGPSLAPGGPANDESAADGG